MYSVVHHSWFVNFLVAVTDIFTKHSWHTLINNSIKQRVIEAPGRPNFTNDVYTALRSTYLAEIHFTGLFRYNPLSCNAQILSDRCRKLSINYKVMLKTMYITFERNFLIAFAKELNCPTPKLYAELFDQEEPELLTNPQFEEWWFGNHEYIEAIFIEALGLRLYNERTKLKTWSSHVEDLDDDETRSIIITPDLAAEVAEACLRLQTFAIQNFHSNNYRLLRLTPLTKYTPGFIQLQQQLLKRMLTLTKREEIGSGRVGQGKFHHILPGLKRNPYRFFHLDRRKWLNYSMQTNGVQVNFTFTQRQKRQRSRSTTSELAKNKNKPLPKKVTSILTPQQKRRRIVDERLSFEALPNFCLVAIDPNQSNLCGYAIWQQGMEHSRSGVLQAPKGKPRTPFNYLDSNISPNNCLSRDFSQYLRQVFMGFPNAPINQQLHQSSQLSIRHHRFDFFIRKQKRFQSFVNIVKETAQDPDRVLIWYGRGTDFADRQRVKSPNKKFFTILEDSIPCLQSCW
ncbi:hypothetical protein RCL1_000424 [Eukaryota sp. TZLM3-RCL]